MCDIWVDIWPIRDEFLHPTIPFVLWYVDFPYVNITTVMSCLNFVAQVRRFYVHLLASVVILLTFETLLRVFWTEVILQTSDMLGI